MIPVPPGIGKGEDMNERPARTWTGIPPSAAVLAKLDYEEMAVLALLSWSSVTNRPVTSADVASLRDRDGTALGPGEAKDIVQSLSRARIMSVFGMNNERPLSVLLGGFQPRQSRRPAFAARSSVPHGIAPQRKFTPRPGRPAGAPPCKWVFKSRRVETGLEMTPSTPPYVMTGAAKLREEQAAVEGGAFGGNLVAAAEARLGVLRGRIALYERWLESEPGHPSLAKVLDKKRKAVPEMEYQIERARVKQAELEAEASGAA